MGSLQPRRLSPGGTVAAATVLLTIAAVFGGTLLADPLRPPFQAADSAWHDSMLGMRNPFWDFVNLVLNWAGYTGMFVFHALLAAALIARRRPRMALFTVVSGLVVTLLVQLLKWLIQRPRPGDAGVFTETFSYPSGHASSTAAFVVAAALLIGRAWAWVLAALGTVSMMISRTYLAAHWLTDVVGGACLAAAVVLLLWLPAQKIYLEENTGARRILTWTARVSRRRREAGQEGSEPR
ncbi:phosphatase PAP2 family protein [Arthrobacter celericrescens]|uniref:phosphatase PAP2 family protein n=1 Tax=Arthrobacter celericrescens TaxID=2320851 RepID=UPI000EA29C66|nr:phosphatase PAP2 family protein [Arthrobacter celericrescens]